MRQWRVVLNPHPDGIVVAVDNGSLMHEVRRVGYDRKTSRNPDVDLPTKLNEIVDQAHEVVDIINAYTVSLVELEDKAADEARLAIKKVLPAIRSKKLE